MDYRKLEQRVTRSAQLRALIARRSMLFLGKGTPGLISASPVPRYCLPETAKRPSKTKRSPTLYALTRKSQQAAGAIGKISFHFRCNRVRVRHPPPSPPAIELLIRRIIERLFRDSLVINKTPNTSNRPAKVVKLRFAETAPDFYHIDSRI